MILLLEKHKPHPTSQMSPDGEYTAHRNNCVLCVYVSGVQAMTAENQQEEGVERSRRQDKSIGARAAVPQVTLWAISAPGLQGGVNKHRD